MTYIIRPEFASLMTPLTVPARAQLKELLRELGCLMPLVVWKETGILLDGYHRHIIMEELGKEGVSIQAPEIKLLSFPSEDAAKSWVFKHARGMRNEADALKVIHALENEPLIAKLEEAAAKRQATGKPQPTLGSREPKVEEKKGRVNEILADFTGVSVETIKKIKAIKRETPEALEKVKNGAKIQPLYNQARIQAKEKELKAAIAATPKAAKGVAGSGVDEIHCIDALDGFKLVPDESVELVVTSPPYPITAVSYQGGGGFGEQFPNYEAYLEWCRKWMSEVFRVLKPGGRFCCEYANCNIPPAERLGNLVYDVRTDFGLIVRSIADAVFLADIIWYKQATNGNRPNNGSIVKLPRIQLPYEFITCWQKGTKGLTVDRKLIDTTPLEHFQLCMGHYYFRPSKLATLHPCPYPEEIPQAMIKLYTYRSCTVLDPFMGRGTTAMAAKRSGRHYIGFELSPAYVTEARKNVAKVKAAKAPVVINVRAYHDKGKSAKKP